MSWFPHISKKKFIYHFECGVKKRAAAAVLRSEERNDDGGL
jgi:hypothetical protein